MGEGSPADSTYRQRRETFAAEERRLARISFRFSLLRGALFLAFIACLAVILVRGGRPGWEWWAGAGFWLVAFLAVLPYHDRTIQRQRRQGELRRVNEEGLLRLARDWDGLPIPLLPEPDDPERPIARDLNLFGRASVAHLLGTVHAPPGKIALADWLLHPASSDEIRRRQEAVAELSPEIDLRQEIEVGVRPMEKSPPDLEPFLRWAEGGPWLLRHAGLVWLARFLTMATPASLIAALATPFPLGVFLLLAMTNLSLGYFLRERTHGVFDKVEAREGQFQLYAEALERIAGRSYSTAGLQRLAGEVTAASARIKAAADALALLDVGLRGRPVAASSSSSISDMLMTAVISTVCRARMVRRAWEVSAASEEDLGPPCKPCSFSEMRSMRSASRSRSGPSRSRRLTASVPRPSSCSSRTVRMRCKDSCGMEMRPPRRRYEIEYSFR
jgi:hypothetical protein